MKRTAGAILVAALCIISLSSCGEAGAIGYCDSPEADSVVWYRGDSVTRAGAMEPGQAYYGEIEACNSDVVTRKVKMETAPYSINQADYENVDFITKTPWNKLADWISFPDGDTYTIGTGETVFLKFRIQVPTDGTAISGTQTASIMLTDVFREDSDSSVGLQTEQRYLWMVTADINGAGLRQEGKIHRWQADGPLVFDNTKGIKTYSLVENTGNVNFTAKYKLKITDLWRNNALAYEAEAEKDIFPESKRANEFVWNEAPAIGIFNIKEEITVYDKTETFEKVVLILPLWFVIIVVAIIILLLWALILKIKKHREKNKRLKS